LSKDQISGRQSIATANDATGLIPKFEDEDAWWRMWEQIKPRGMSSRLAFSQSTLPVGRTVTMAKGAALL
jgi:hypothetical protein